MPDPQHDILHILRTLASQRVDFIVVGGVCGVLHGAPVTTFDLDLVHARDAGNVQRLMPALEELDARYRDPAGRLLHPTAAMLASAGHHLLMTSGGPLDLLGEITGGRDYIALLPVTTVFDISSDLHLRALSLEALIESKQLLGREKDRAVLSILRRTLEATKGSSDTGDSEHKP